MSAFNIWAENPPPTSTSVLAKYKLTEPWQSLRTCRRGCCVYDSEGVTMLLPKYWKPAERINNDQS